MNELITAPEEIQGERLESPIEPQLLDRLVRGIIRAGNVIEPALQGTEVQVIKTTGVRLTGVCLGFLQVSHDMNVRSPFLTLETICQEGTVARYHIPPQTIHAIEPLQ